MNHHRSTRRSFLKSGAALGAGAAAMLVPGFGSAQTAPLPGASDIAKISDAERAKLGWEGLDLPAEAIDGPWRNLHAVIEKQVIDCHCHPWETRKQGTNSVEVRADHDSGDYVDFSDQMVASMDRHGIGYVVCNPAFAAYEDQLSTSFRKHKDRFWLSCGFPVKGRKNNTMTAEETADILRRQIVNDGAVLVGETAGGSIMRGTPKEVQPIADLLEEFDIPIQIHTGWGQTGITRVASGEVYTSAADWAKRIAIYMQAFPKVKFMIGHQGGQLPNPDGWEATRLFFSFDNAYAEVSKVQPEIIEACVKGRGAEKVIWGSDWNRPTPKTYGPYLYRASFQHWFNLNSVARADITEEERNWVLYKSARKLLRLPETPLKSLGKGRVGA